MISVELKLMLAYFNTALSNDKSCCSFQTLPLLNAGRRDKISSAKRGVPGFSE